MYRQGDILLVPISEIPEKARKEVVNKGRVVLARGEATNHLHVIDSPAATLYGKELEERFLEIVGHEEVDLVHTSNPVEHATLTIAPGKYKVVRQREYTPEAVRRVSD